MKKIVESSKISRGWLLFVGLSVASWPLGADVIQVSPQPQNPDQFQGVQTTGVVRSAVNFQLGGNPWQTTTDPLSFESASLLEAQGLENPFLQALSNNLGAGWSYTFNTTANLADNTFQVHTYEALAPGPPVSNSDGFVGPPERGSCATNNNCVGSAFYLHYNPTGDDPTGNVHWIQVLYDNYDDNNNTVAPFYEIDNAGGSIPYYDVPYRADSTGFLDRPYRSGPPAQPTIFDAMLLLVTGPAANKPGQVTIYGAVDWGWSTDPVPEPSSAFLFLAGAFLIFVGLARRRKAAFATYNKVNIRHVRSN